ncbi:hypothetical protein [Ottowia sp.]|uniref:hypothetical protein n=1 Tax=Ottowia sp. TaxID=1898956 RepID=UPI003A8BC39E
MFQVSHLLAEPVGQARETLLDRELFIDALRHMIEEDLRYLNRMVVERLNLLIQAKSTVALVQFAEGDRVQFTTSEGVVKRGVVLQLNKKTVSLRTEEGQHWKVSPGLLCKTPGQ